MNTHLKNKLFKILYAVQWVLYLMRITLYRLYLLGTFLMARGAAILLAVCIGGGFYALKTLETGFLSGLPPLAIAHLASLRDTMWGLPFIRDMYDPVMYFNYEIVAALMGFWIFLVMRISTKILAPIFFAFPMPRRPLPPVLRWEPPEHTIPAVRAKIVTPQHLPGVWDGDFSRITAQLSPPLQAIMGGQGVQAPMAHLSPVASVSAARAVAQPADPPPADTTNGRGQFIPPANAGQSPSPS